VRTLNIVTAVSNPIEWKSRIDLAEKAVEHWLREPNVKITVVECIYGGRTYSLDYLAAHDRITHIPVKAETLLWIKENLLNIGIHHLPPDAQYVATIDADVVWRKKGWANDVIHALDLYSVVQPWQHCYDLGPNDEHIWTHKSFAALNREGKPVVPRFDAGLNLTNSPYQYPHPGYAWAWRRDFLNWTGGLFEWGGVGSGDHHMALSLVSNAHMSIPQTVNGNYKALLLQWQNLANKYNGYKLGHTNHTIEHYFHGRKENRGYNDRWKMFLDHNFDPVSDIKRNTYGVLEFAGNKPQLEAEWERYLRGRNEDVNSLT
jgi:hypothetical protein